MARIKQFYLIRIKIGEVITNRIQEDFFLCINILINILIDQSYQKDGRLLKPARHQSWQNFQIEFAENYHDPLHHHNYYCNTAIITFVIIINIIIMDIIILTNRRLASFVKILNQEDISKHQNHDTIQEVYTTKIQRQIQITRQILLTQPCSEPGTRHLLQLNLATSISPSLPP